MMIPYFLCMCLLLTLSGGICSKIFVSIGVSIPLFTNVSENEHVMLYKNGNVNSTLFAMWKIEDGKITAKYNANDKIHMVYTATYDIWILRIDQNDQGKYFILYGTNVTGPEADLIIMGLFVRINQGYAINGVIGLNTTITCSTYGTTSVIWLAPNGSIINPALAASKYSINFNSITRSSTLTISMTATSDNGSYTCCAANSLGHSLCDSIQLSPVSPFVKISVGDAINVVIGLNTTITCSTCGSTSVTWFAPDGSMINPALAASKYSINFNGTTGSSTLTIISIETSDNGPYTCIGENSLGLSLRDSIQLSAVNGLESDWGMKVNFMSFIFGAAGLIAGLIGMIIMIILICCNKKSQDWLWKMVFRTYLEKLTVKQVGMDIQKWLKNHEDFNYNPDEHLPTGGPHHSDYGIVQSGHYEAEDQKQTKIEDFMANFSPYLAVEETNPLLREGQAADQSSGPQQHEEHLPPPCFPCSSNLVLDSNEVLSSEA